MRRNRLLPGLRSARRLGLFLIVASLALLHAAWLTLVERKIPPTTRRARWLRHWSARVRSLIGVEAVLHGRAPDGGMLVCNHVSYLDMPALTAATEMIFISKAEVRQWPLIGTLAKLGSTLFLDRTRRSPVMEVAGAVTPIVAEGVVVALFPEGTSTAGDHVLPFHSSLLAPAAEHGWPVTPAWIGYEVEDGCVAKEVAYWRDMTFLPHFLNLLGKRRIRAIVRFGEPLRNADRKALARDLHRAVVALGQSLTAKPTGAGADGCQTPAAAAFVSASRPAGTSRRETAQ